MSKIISNKVLTTKARKKLKDSDFALPGRRYPIADEAHAKNALARVSEYGTSEEKKKVRAAVHRKYPDIKESEDSKESTQNTQEATLVVNSFQAITANVSGRVRHEVLEGKNYDVYPCVMLTEGVHAGSQGPLLYTTNELKKSAANWAYKPIVINHPQRDGQAISACLPEVIENRKVGLIMNTSFESGRYGTGKSLVPGKLKAEAWIEPDRLQVMVPEVYNALKKGQPWEISTGLFSDNLPVENKSWNGTPYVAEVRNMRADHLAVLTGGEKGACRDGGLLKNRKPKFLLNEYSHGEIRDKLHQAIKEHPTLPIGLPGETAIENPVIKDIYGTFCVYSHGGKDYKQDYHMGEDGEPELHGPPEEVRSTKVYHTHEGEILNSEQNSEQNGDAMPGNYSEQLLDRDGLIDVLIDNGAWSELDREFLESLDDSQLDHIALNAGMKRQDSGIDTIEDEGEDDASETIRDAKGQVAPKKGGKRVGGVAEDSGDENPNAANSRSNSDKEDALNHTKPKRTAREKKEDEENMSKKGSEPNGKGVQNAEYVLGHAVTNATVTPLRPRKVTVEDYIRSAPPAIQDMLTNGLASYNAEKNGLIELIMNNEANQFSRPQLNQKHINELKAIAALAQGSWEAAPVANNYFSANYAGQADAYGSQADFATTQEPLSVPVLNFERKQD